MKKKPNLLHYKGYDGSVEVSLEDGCLHGKLLHIRSLVTYESDDVAGLKRAFEESVDDYLETCEEMGWEPHKPYKGVFNVRISKEEHRAAAISAFRQGYASLNEFVREAIQEKIQREGTMLGREFDKPERQRPVRALREQG